MSSLSILYSCLCIAAVVSAASPLKDVPENSPPLLVAITATYSRASQAMHITNLVNILRLIPPPFLWIVVETEKNWETRKLLARTAGQCIFVGAASRCTSLNYVHLNDSQAREDPAVSRGVHQRNAALQYVEENRIDGIVAFVDDDNAYSLNLFQEFRKVKRVGIVPVGFLWTTENHQQQPNDWDLNPRVQRPLVRVKKDGSKEVYGWETFRRAKWWSQLVHHTDMASFAFRSNLLWLKPNQMGYPQLPLRFQKKLGMLESLFLSQLVPGPGDLEPLADDCQDVLVWHVKFEARWLPYPREWRLAQPTNLVPGEYKGGYFVVNGTSYRPKGYDADRPPGYW